LILFFGIIFNCSGLLKIYKGVKENKIEYEYDYNKNWIKQISYLDDKRLKVITREIEYYN